MAGRMPRSRQRNASKTCGICMIIPTSSRPGPAAFSFTSALVRDRKLAPKNFTNEASVSALVRMAMAAKTAR